MTKTEFMLIGLRQKLNNLPAPPALEINGTHIGQVRSTKSLGIIIDENLTWVNHSDTISKKIAAGIYRGIVQSHFDYCNVVWDSCSKTLSDKLQRLQNRAARVLTYSNYDADANELMKILGWKNLETQRQIHKAQMAKKSLNGLVPNYLSSKFIQRSDIITSYNLRDSKNKLAIPLRTHQLL